MTNVLYCSLPERALKPPPDFKAAASREHVLVVLDEYGIGIARQVEVDGSLYARHIDVTSEVRNRQTWPRLFEQLDREFAALLAYHGVIPLPDEFRK